MSIQTSERRREVVFLTREGSTKVDMLSNDLGAMCAAARSLQARYFITVDGRNEALMLPIWGVFDMRTAQQNNPAPGDWTINDPVRTFTSETSDAAVMWAMARSAM